MFYRPTPGRRDAWVLFFGNLFDGVNFLHLKPPAFDMNSALLPCDGDAIDGNGLAVSVPEHLAKDFARALRRFLPTQCIARKVNPRIVRNANELGGSQFAPQLFPLACRDRHVT